MLTAVTVALLYVATLVPTGQIGLCAAAGVIPAAPLSRRRVALGISVYVTSSILALLVLPQKSAAFAYTIVFGSYTLVKYTIEKLRSPILQWICKILYAGCALVLIVTVALAVSMPEVQRFSTSAHPNVLPIAALLLYYAVFIAYDIAFSRLVTLLRRIFPKE